jgi:hypothetical protein
MLFIKQTTNKTKKYRKMELFHLNGNDKLVEKFTSFLNEIRAFRTNQTIVSFKAAITWDIVSCSLYMGQHS